MGVNICMWCKERFQLHSFCVWISSCSEPFAEKSIFSPIELSWYLKIAHYLLNGFSVLGEVFSFEFHILGAESNRKLITSLAVKCSTYLRIQPSAIPMMDWYRREQYEPTGLSVDSCLLVQGWQWPQWFSRVFGEAISLGSSSSTGQPQHGFWHCTQAHSWPLSSRSPNQHFYGLLYIFLLY